MEHLVTRDGRLRLWTPLRRVAPGEVYAYWHERDRRKAWWPDSTTLTPSEAKPGRRLVFELSGVDASENRVVVDFERRDDDTLVTVTQGPLPDTAEAPEAEALETWTRLLGRLKAALERSS